MTNLATLYQTDYAAWAQRNAELLRERRFAELDIEHLLDELSDMSKSDRRELHSRLLVLLAHLLKWPFQYGQLSDRWREFKGDSWRSTIVEQREQLADLLRQSPGLKAALDDTIAAAYAGAVRLAHKETRLPTETFPAVCPYRQEQILDDDFYPEAR
jgi:transposase